jgi:Dolichyl-phosphate-mannose-protein mannosyltransferase
VVETVAPDTGLDSSSLGTAGLRARARTAVQRAWPAITVYFAIRIVSTLVFWALSDGRGYAQRGLFVFVDSGWYRLIAEHGYDTHVPGVTFGSPFPFFPLYPGLMRLGSSVTGLGVDVVGVAVTWAAAGLAAWAMFEIGRRLRDARTGLLFAALWALLPSAAIEGASYADTLAIALSAWALYALLRRWWIAATVFACLAGLTRPTANAVVVTVCLAALITLVRSRGRGLRPWIALVVPPLGPLGFLAYVAVRMGSLGGYLQAQQQWGTGFSNIQSVHYRIHQGIFSHGVYAGSPYRITTAVILIVPVLIALIIVRRLPWELICYTVMVAAIVYTSIHVYTVVPREFLALFPVLLPVAAALARVRSRAVLGGFLGIMAVAAGYYACFIPVMRGAIP